MNDPAKSPFPGTLLRQALWIMPGLMAGHTLVLYTLTGWAFTRMLAFFCLAFILFIVAFTAGAQKLEPGTKTFYTFLLLVAGWLGFAGLSGGAGNPLLGLLIPLVSLGALLLPANGAVIIAGLSLAGYLLLGFLFRPVPLPPALADHLHLLAMGSTFFIAVLFATWTGIHLRSHLRYYRKTLAYDRQQAERDTWLIGLGSLAATTAHELGTPLNTMLLLVSDMHMHPPGTDLREDLDMLHKQLERCRTALAQLTRNARSLAPPEPQPLQLWLQMLVREWLQGQEHPPTVKTGMEPALAQRNFRPDAQVSLAMTHLLDNATRYQAGQIDIQLSANSDTLTLVITDNGLGISREALEAFAFGDPFQGSDGMGIGLLLTRGIFERLGGSMRIDFVVPHGTRVSLTLPFAAV